MESLRRIEVKESEWNNRPNYEFENYLAYFHKWVDIHSKLNGRINQGAIIEKEDGTVKIISLEDYSIRFITLEEETSQLIEENMKGWELSTDS